MRVLAATEEIPADAFYVAVIDGVVRTYEATDAEYIEIVFNQLVDVKTVQITNQAQSKLADGFMSVATGGQLIYSLSAEDVQDLSNLIDVGVAANYRAGDQQRFKAHTLNELKQVKSDGVKAKFDIYEKRELLIDAINAATTVEEIEAISW